MTDPYSEAPGSSDEPGADSPAPHADQGALARPGAAGVPAPAGDNMGSLLRLRDVQALNRSFGRLAEVQESLLEHMVQMHEERGRPSRLSAFVLAVCTAILGVGLGLLGMAWLDQQRGVAPVNVSAPPPQIVVSPPNIEVLVPESSLDGELFAAMREQMESLRTEREADREMMRGLAEQLFDRESANLTALREATLAAAGAANAGSAVPQPRAPLASGGTDGSASDSGAVGNTAAALPLEDARTPSQPGEAARTWLAVANGLLALDGYDYLYFDRGERTAGTAELGGVVLMEWDDEGLIDNVLKADKVGFELHQMTGTLVMRFSDGHRTRGGQRIALPAGGARMNLLGVNVDAWLEHWPALAGEGEAVSPAAGEAPAAEASAPAAAIERTRAAVDELLSRKAIYGYYRLASVGGIDAAEGLLRLVQIQHFDAPGTLVKTYEADTLQVRLHASGTVELLMRKGAFVEDGQRRPFYEDRFRLYLPRQQVAEWRATGAPYEEAGS